MLVALSKAYSGYVSHSEIYRGTAKTESLYKPGDKVEVIVLSVDKTNRDIDLSMKIPVYDKTRNWKVGTQVQGTITDINPHGIWVNIAPGIDGRLLDQNIKEERSGLFGLGGMKKPTMQTGMTIVATIISIKPDRKNPDKMNYELQYVRAVK